jgi:hypothetical protein
MNRKVEEFVRLALERVAPKAAKAARDNLWNALNAEEKKQTNESLLFISFASATRLVPDPFEHINANSPRPDIRTSIGGHDYYFELGEITDEDLARGISNALKTKAVSGCAISQVEPLLKMLTQKCQKHYVTDGDPVDLLLYYWRQGPSGDSIDHDLGENLQDIESQFGSSQFAKIWIYDLGSNRVLWKIEK